MSNGKSREQFENWITTSGLEADLSRGNHGCYLNPPTHWLYCAWVASRDAIEVELPAFEGYQQHIVRELQAAFSGAADRAGLKVKP